MHARTTTTGKSAKAFALAGGITCGLFAGITGVCALKKHCTQSQANKTHSTHAIQNNTMSRNFQPSVIYKSDGTVKRTFADSAYNRAANANNATNISAEQIAERAGVNLRDCYQCGKCSAGCPMYEGMDLGPKQVMRKLQMGLVDEALHAKSPWICAQCMTCASRCPQNIDISELMRAVRMCAHEAGIIASKESDVFESEFIKGVRTYGKNSESYLAAFYNLKSKHLLQDIFNAPKMLTKSLINARHEKVRDQAGVRALVDRCLQENNANVTNAKCENITDLLKNTAQTTSSSQSSAETGQAAQSSPQNDAKTGGK